MEEQYRVFDHDGIWIDQLSTSVERAYGITRETTAKFAISTFDAKCHPFTLNYGNSLLCENSDGLKPWAGMIDLLGFDRGVGMCWAFTPEHWFFYRRGPRRQTLTGRAGEIFAQMINIINTIDNTPLMVGDISSNTNIMQETLNPISLSQNLKQLVAGSGECYRWRPEVVNGKLRIYGDWFPSAVLDTGLILQDGWNVTGDHPMSMEPPINDQLSYGTGTDWSTRIISQAIDESSRNRYGLRQTSQSISTKIQNTLEVVNRLTLEKFREPQYEFPISVLNVSDTFAKLEPGALAAFTQLVGQGFSNDGLGYINYSRVVNVMNFNPMDEKVGIDI